MVSASVLDRRGGQRRRAVVHEMAVRPLPTLAIGMVGGLIVGLTSVGSGSLMIVLLLFLYPMLGASQLVGTDLTQAVPLTLAAALGALAFGHVEFAVTTSLIIGSVPRPRRLLLSSRAPDRFIRPAITFVIFASGLKYVGVGDGAGPDSAAALLAGRRSGWPTSPLAEGVLPPGPGEVLAGQTAADSVGPPRQTGFRLSRSGIRRDRRLVDQSSPDSMLVIWAMSK